MSLILEALKKSERQRLLGTAPTLASPVMAVRRRRNMGWPLLVVLVLVAAGIGGWWLYQRSARAPAQLARQSAQAPTGAVDNSATPAFAQKQQPPVGKVATPAATPPAANRTTPVVMPVAPAVAAKSERPSVNPVTTEKAKVASPASVVTKPAPPAGEPAAPVAAKPTSAKPVAAAPALGSPASAETAKTSPPTPVAPAAAPAADTPPLIWALPYSLRKDLPPLTLSMQVYADDPAERFAIINDERHVEGDTIGTGDLTLVEIRQDGLIMEMKGQRFLYPRGGR